MNTLLSDRPYLLMTQNRTRVAALVFSVALLGLIIALLTTNNANASVIIAEDDFEGHAEGPTGYGWLDDWEFEENVDYRNNQGPYEGDSHLMLRGEGASAVRSADISGDSSLRLQVWVKEDNFDDNTGVIEVSADGSNYVELNEWDDDEDYAFFDFDLSTTGLSFTTQIWVRARILGDDNNDGRLYLDNLVLLNSEDDPEPEPPTSGNPVLVDGQFSDWPGKANLGDAFNDNSGSDRNDIATFYWANNIDEEINYHMLERHTTDRLPYDGTNGQNGLVRYLVYIDTNNNGDYSEGEDRRVIVTYVPTPSRSLVNVKIYPGDSFSKISNSGWNDWGDSRNDGGLRVEFPLDWDDLDIQFGGVIRMYAVSFDGLGPFPIIRDRVPDGNADIQWSPASVLGPWLLGAAGIFGIFAIWYISRRRRLWT